MKAKFAVLTLKRSHPFRVRNAVQFFFRLIDRFSTRFRSRRRKQHSYVFGRREPVVGSSVRFGCLGVRSIDRPGSLCQACQSLQLTPLHHLRWSRHRTSSTCPAAAAATELRRLLIMPRSPRRTIVLCFRRDDDDDDNNNNTRIL